MYKKVSANLDFVAREKETLEFWKENKVFERSLELTKDGKPFNFYDGPPTANGKPHIGHILTRVMKDIIPRYKTMRGFFVRRKAGWDTHGLPVELEVEKLLGIDGKQEIEKYGVEAFIAKCKESVWKYQKEWEEMSGRVGYWVDMDDPYVTYDDKYIESVWWSIAEIAKKGLLYKGHKIVPYCSRCGTSLSSHEVAQGYKDVTDETVVVGFEVVGKKDTYFLAWTTTPWTLLSNVALCVNPKQDYVTVEYGDRKYILAKALVGKHFPELSGGQATNGRSGTPAPTITPTQFQNTKNPAFSEQVIRPTGLVDPQISVRPVQGQIDDLLDEIKTTTKNNERVLVTTLTKKMAESLSKFLSENGQKVRYLHSDIGTLERIEIINGLRAGEFDVLVGINLLREGLDIPEVSLVAILDADKEGFLRSTTSLIQTIGRAARNANGRVIMYANTRTKSMDAAINETDRRREKQEAYNNAEGIVPKTIVKPIKNTLNISSKDEIKVDVKDIPETIEKLKALMAIASSSLDFEKAIELREKIGQLKKMQGRMG